MPTIAHVSVRFSRKYQIRKDDWVGLEALVTLAVSEEEANTVDPYEVTAEAFAIAKEAVREQRDEIRRAQQDARARATAAAQAQPMDTLPAPEQAPIPGGAPVAEPPRTPEEAERRFFARYGAQIGGATWADAQRYLGQRGAKPTTVDGWLNAARAVRDHATAQNGSA